MKILFVCTGNTCRSPMAQALAKLYLPEGFNFFSAGINAFGESISDNAAEVLKEKGIDLSTHLSVRLTEEMLYSADYVFTMTGSQQEYLARMYPDFRDKIHCLGYWLGFQQDVTDPWGASLEVYRRCLTELEQMLKALAAKLSKGTSLAEGTNADNR